MSFRVKEYHSKLEWKLGRGGFGSVYLGYKLSADSEEFSAGTRTPSTTATASSTRSLCHCCRDHGGQEQVAIKLEKVGSDQAFLAAEAKVLKAVQGGPGIPKFLLLSHTIISTSPVRPMTPPLSPRAPKHRQPPARSPLSSPGQSPEFAVQQQNEPFRPEPALPPPTPTTAANAVFGLNVPPPGSSHSSWDSLGKLEAYNALVLERLGKNLETIFRKHLQGGQPLKNPHFELRFNVATSPDMASSELASRPVGVDPRLCRSAPGSPAKRMDLKPFPQIRHIESSEGLSSSRRGLGWSHKTICWIGCQVLRSLEWVHAYGYVHRDIPENLCIGKGLKNDTVYLVDFGMASSFRNPDGSHMDRNEKTRGCIGTQSFMSYKCGGSRRDDVESLAYVLIYLFKGTLPWAKQVDAFEESFAKSGQRWTAESIQYNANIQRMKEKMLQGGEWLKEYPRELQAFIRYVASLQFADKPDYHYLRSILQDMRRRNKPISSAPSPATTPINAKIPLPLDLAKCKHHRPGLRTIKTA